MATELIHRVLDTCLALGAREVWLLAGRPPILRYANDVRELNAKRLTAEAVVDMTVGALAPHDADAYRARGMASFSYPYAWRRRDLTFRVIVVRHGASSFATLTPVDQLALCANCGYDLRATPERCPECGTVPA